MESKKTKNNYILAGIILFFVFVNLIWFKIDEAPPMWDQSHYLEISEVLYHTLTQEGVIAFIKAFTGVLQTKAPLITVLPIPLYAMFGENYTSALYINVIFVILGSYYFYKLGTLISREKEALGSVFILNTFPLIFAMSREFLVEYGLMTLVIIWMYYFVKSNYFENEKYNYTLGIVFGLGMLMKITFLLYIFFPTVFVLIKKVTEPKKYQAPFLKNIFVVLLVGAVVSGTWYFNNLKTIVRFAIMAGYGDMAKNWSIGDVYSIKTMLKYWFLLVNTGISAYYFVLLVFLLPLTVLFFIRNKSFFNIDKLHFFSLLIWFFFPFIIFTFAVNKDYRYIAPFVPPLALMISIALIQLPVKKYGTFLLCMLLLFPTFSYFHTSFSSKSVNVRWKQLTFLDNALSYAHPPVKEQWPNEKLVKFIYQDAVRITNNNALTTVLFNHCCMNFITLNYYSKKNNYGISFKPNDPSAGDNIDEITARIQKESSYIITKSDNLGPDLTNTKNVQVIPLLNKGLLNFKPVATIPLPDHTFLTIYKRTVDVSLVYSDIGKLKNLQLTPGKSVNFSNTIKLLDYEVKETPEGYALVFLWECLNAIDLHYKVFVRVKANDRENKMILSADHYPNRDYPTFKWRKGEIIKDVVTITAVLPKDFHIYIGLYEETIAARLLVQGKSQDAPENINGVRIF